MAVGALRTDALSIIYHSSFIPIIIIITIRKINIETFKKEIGMSSAAEETYIPYDLLLLFKWKEFNLIYIANIHRKSVIIESGERVTVIWRKRRT